MNLSQKRCVPCEAGTPPLAKDKVEEFLREVSDWQLNERGKLSRAFRFKDFRESLAFVNQVAKIAEEEGHHPDIKVVYNRVTLELITHAIGGLSENDFILAAKISELAKRG